MSLLDSFILLLTKIMFKLSDFKTLIKYNFIVSYFHTIEKSHQVAVRVT